MHLESRLNILLNPIGLAVLICVNNVITVLCMCECDFEHLIHEKSFIINVIIGIITVARQSMRDPDS